MHEAERLPALRKIVVVDPRGVRQLDHPLVMTLSDLEALGEERRRSNGARRRPLHV